MEIKAATVQDHEVLTEVMRGSKAIWGYEKEQLEEWKDELTITQDHIKKNSVFNLWKDDQIIGFYSYKQQGPNLKLDSLFVHPEFIGQGMGNIMMTDFLERVKPISKERIVLDADPNAESYYNKYDFNTIALKKTSIPNRFMPIMAKNNPNLEETHLFDSKRLFVRHLSLEDLDDFYDMQRNPNVMQYIKPEMNYEEAKKELERFIGYYEDRKKMFRIWAIIEKQTNTFIGICGVYLNKNNEEEIAYRLRELYWGKGYGGEIAERLFDFCFETLDYDELYAYVMEENQGSIKILEKHMSYDKIIHSEETNSKEYIYKTSKENWIQHRNL
ncbi:GNAT family N-acetyltransferase [Aquimarina algicola]|uniref:GNAT family N-acetyltransferase n=1 Tax=Aquimarina algicola TaxID=2589995 RepID=A0A504J103_9FLAO|nr:GNAT family N-acetyltransferase [Aquimarina algicola]TPN81373.1 GNAT family N-acetyltransferase [Aquimarina algicola]